MTPVILLHAFPVDRRIWKAQADALSGEFEIIAPDLRGFGESYERLDGREELPIDPAADDLLALLEERGIDRAVICGISRGGYIAMAFARRYPQRLRALMLFDTRAASADDKEKQWYSQFLEKLAAEGMSCVPELMMPRMLGPTALGGKPDLVQQVTGIILSQKAEAVRAAAIGMMNRPDASLFLAQIGVPTLAVAGTEDGAFAATRAIAESIPGAAFVAVENAGHLSIMEQPDFVIAAMRRFLQSII